MTTLNLYKKVTSQVRGPFFQPLVAVVTAECHFRKRFPSAMLFGFQETPQAFKQRQCELIYGLSVVNTSSCIIFYMTETFLLFGLRSCL